ncbi:MAG: Vitamin B12 transporter BtuB [Myxococcota bacterium]|nr:Vitamin B12 transporter BtuB [Myxococcota bacterium]
MAVKLNFHLIVLGCASMCLWNLPVSAGSGGDLMDEDLGASSGVLAVPEVVVTGARSPRPLADSTVATEVISAREAEKAGQLNLAEVLEEYPGLEVVRSFRGAQLRMQGLDPKYVLVLVDGDRVAGRVDGGVDLTRFTIEDIERVEIVKGPSSSLYGSEAIGGVVNIITRRANRAWFADVSAQGGSFAGVDSHGSLGFRRGWYSGVLSGGYRRQDPYRVDPASTATSGSAFQSGRIATNHELDLTSHARLGLRGDFNPRVLRAVDANAAGAVFDRANSQQIHSGVLSGDFRLRDADRLQARASLSYWNDDFVSDQRNSNALDRRQESTEWLGSALLQYDAMLHNQHLLTGGVDGLFQRLASERLKTGDGERTRVSPFLQYEWFVLRAPLLTLSPGFRLDADSQFGVFPSPKLAARFDPHKWIALRASYGWGFRSPDFRELLLNFENPGAGYVVEGNPDLRPERARAINASVEFHPLQELWWSVNYFRNDLDDLIQADTVGQPAPGAPTRFGYVNVAAARTQGVETHADIRPVRWLRLNAGYVLLDARDLDSGLALTGRAAHRITGGVTMEEPRSGLELGGRLQWQGSRPFYPDEDGDGVLSRQDARPFTTLDARIGWTFYHQIFTVFAGCNNIANAGDPALTPIQPRTFFAGLQARMDSNTNLGD